MFIIKLEIDTRGIMMIKTSNEIYFQTPSMPQGSAESKNDTGCKITKTVADSKGTSIAKFKLEIETSKAFIDALKKSKDKSPDCILRPKVTAQSKGAKTTHPAYKGIFANMEEAEEAQKTISVVPGRDGSVYEIRNTEMGKFITRTAGDALLSDISAGFKRTLPLIPFDLMVKVMSFFRCLSQAGQGFEALVNVYWDTASTRFFADVPKQTVSKASIEARATDEFSCSRYIHYMDIHSHNTMRAAFSDKDNNDEKATRLYAVMGSLQNYLPEIKVRASCGGKFIEVEPSDVFEGMHETSFPGHWMDKISFDEQIDSGNADNARRFMTLNATGPEMKICFSGKLNA